MKDEISKVESIDPLIRSLRQLQETLDNTSGTKWDDVNPNQLKATYSKGFSVPDKIDFSKTGNYSFFTDSKGKFHFIDHDKGICNKIKKLRRFLPQRWLIMQNGKVPYWEWQWMKKKIMKSSKKFVW
jgi:hypothetical protein